MRDESFGALAYAYGTRRLVFLKSRLLVDLVRALGHYRNAACAIEGLIPERERSAYRLALELLAISGVINAR